MKRPPVCLSCILKGHRVCARGLLSEAGVCVWKRRGQKEVMRLNALKQGTCLYPFSMRGSFATKSQHLLKGSDENLKRDSCLGLIGKSNEMSGHEKSNTNECSLRGEESGREICFSPVTPITFKSSYSDKGTTLLTENYTTVGFHSLLGLYKKYKTCLV